MSTYLDQILKHKRDEVLGLTLPDLKRTRPLHDPVASLSTRPFIAEVKRASPSEGEIAMNDDILSRAFTYAENGAGAISVLTDEKYFHGSFDDLQKIAVDSSLPLLCKDFIVSEIQLDRAFLSGADMILLIVAGLNDDELARLSRGARDRGMQVLYEIHELDEWFRIESMKPEMVGVNSRDLRTFHVDTGRGAAIISELPDEIFVVAESGIASSSDVEKLSNAGADAFLVGTALMKAEDPGATLRELYRGLE